MRGFTLIELITVISVMAILSAIALPGFGRLMSTMKVKDAATNLYLAMTKARSEAIKRSIPVTISPVGGSWTNGWQITDPGGVVLSSQGAITGSLSIAAVDETDNSALASVIYVPSGRIRDNHKPKFTVTKTGSDKSWMKRCITTAATGSPHIITDCP
jgi:type IV fimbrial biogenesis protein FimT